MTNDLKFRWSFIKEIDGNNQKFYAHQQHFTELCDFPQKRVSGFPGLNSGDHQLLREHREVDWRSIEDHVPQSLLPLNQRKMHRVGDQPHKSSSRRTGKRLKFYYFYNQYLVLQDLKAQAKDSIKNPRLFLIEVEEHPSITFLRKSTNMYPAKLVAGSRRKNFLNLLDRSICS